MSKISIYVIAVSAVVVWAGWSWFTPSTEPQNPNPSGDPCYLFTEDAGYLEFDLRLHLRDNKIVPFRVPIDYVEDRKMYPNGGELTAKGFRVGMEHFERYRQVNGRSLRLFLLPTFTQPRFLV